MRNCEEGPCCLLHRKGQQCLWTNPEEHIVNSPPLTWRVHDDPSARGSAHHGDHDEAEQAAFPRVQRGDHRSAGGSALHGPRDGAQAAQLPHAHRGDDHRSAHAHDGHPWEHPFRYPGLPPEGCLPKEAMENSCEEYLLTTLIRQSFASSSKKIITGIAPW